MVKLISEDMNLPYICKLPRVKFHFLYFFPLCFHLVIKTFINKFSISSLTVVVLAILISGEATSSHGCYFPYEMQHSYNENVITVSQQNTWRQHKINPINITADSISMLGDCYRYLANNHLLIVLLNGTTKQLCYRCIYLKLVTRYIVKINLETQVSDDIKRLYLTRCYSNEIEAMRNCPDTDGTTLYIFSKLYMKL